MKSHSFPRRSPTPVTHKYVTDELQVVGVYDAPCRNRTCNLMIKSHVRASLLARTGAAQLAPSASNVAELVPQTSPNRARRFPDNSPCQSPLDLLYGNPCNAIQSVTQRRYKANTRRLGCQDTAELTTAGQRVGTRARGSTRYKRTNAPYAKGGHAVTAAGLRTNAHATDATASRGTATSRGGFCGTNPKYASTPLNAVGA